MSLLLEIYLLHWETFIIIVSVNQFNLVFSLQRKLKTCLKGTLLNSYLLKDKSASLCRTFFACML